MDSQYEQVASNEDINQTAEALKANGFAVHIVENAAEAKEKVVNLIPKGSEVFTGTSITLDETGIGEAVNGPDFVSLRNKMMELYGQPDKKKDMVRLTAAPDFMVSSAHALTHDGKIIVASASGSQIPTEAYGASQVIFVVGAQKLVKDLDAGITRIKDYIVPLEDARAMAAYGAHTSFNKLLVINKEMPDRITVVIIKEKLGY